MNFTTCGIKQSPSGVKHRQPPRIGQPDLWVDCRAFPNPHHEYRNLTGKDAAVVRWLTQKIESDASLKRMYDAIVIMVENTRSRCGSNAKVAFYCYGGRHRSVYVAERVATELRSVQHQIEVEHLELP